MKHNGRPGLTTIGADFLPTPDCLANISHELRTPMNTIMGMTDLSLEEDLPNRVRDYLQTARESAGALLGILEELLEYSAVAIRTPELKTHRFDLPHVLESTVSSFEAEAHGKGLTLAQRIDERVPRWMVGDAARLALVLENLISNAIKFTSQGAVTVSVETEHISQHTAALRFRVTDTGIGIGRDDQERIFAPFVQVDSSSTRRFGGVGLGLTVAQSLVRKMGGGIELTSEIGSGSTFSFAITLPIAVVPSEPLPHITVPWRPLQVLLAEDTPANQKLVAAILTKRGHWVSVAADGLEAVGLIESRPFDAAIMDVWMPRMDGLEATSLIRSRERPDTRGLPIIAVTAHAMAADRDRCLAAGANAYMAKPVNADSLIKTVEELARIESRGLPNAPAPDLTSDQVGRSEAQVFDMSSALARLGGDMELFVKLVGFFEEDGPRLFAQVQEGVNQGNAAVVERAAHSLKGLTANFSALAAVEAALRLEDMGRAGDISMAADAVADLGTQLALLAKALAAFKDANRHTASRPESPDTRTGGTNDSVHH